MSKSIETFLTNLEKLSSSLRAISRNTITFYQVIKFRLEELTLKHALLQNLKKVHICHFTGRFQPKIVTCFENQKDL